MIDALFSWQYQKWRDALQRRAAYRHAVKASLRAERRLQDARDEQETQAAVDALLSAYAKREEIAAREAFRLGFALAAELAMELHAG